MNSLHEGVYSNVRFRANRPLHARLERTNLAVWPHPLNNPAPAVE